MIVLVTGLLMAQVDNIRESWIATGNHTIQPLSKSKTLASDVRIAYL
jgi:hypothetical protein